jgi:hypothetical protein
MHAQRDVQEVIDSRFKGFGHRQNLKVKITTV